MAMPYNPYANNIVTLDKITIAFLYILIFKQTFTDFSTMDEELSAINNRKVPSLTYLLMATIRSRSLKSHYTTNLVVITTKIMYNFKDMNDVEIVQYKLNFHKRNRGELWHF